jgi:hypothetical protein
LLNQERGKVSNRNPQDAQERHLNFIVPESEYLSKCMEQKIKFMIVAADILSNHETRGQCLGIIRDYTKDIGINIEEISIATANDYDLTEGKAQFIVSPFPQLKHNSNSTDGKIPAIPEDECPIIDFQTWSSSLQRASNTPSELPHPCVLDFRLKTSSR